MPTVDLLVSPVAGGWMVEPSTTLASLVFRSGGRAEAAAEELAKAVTAGGVDARVVVHDRTGQVVGTKRFRARTTCEPELFAVAA